MTDAEQIYRDYHDRVLAFFRSRLSRYEDAEDLCADVFIKVYRRLPDFDRSKASLSTWIYTISRNTLTDHFRTRRETEELPENLPSPDGVDQHYLKEETLAELARALGTLPEELRDIIVLRYSENLSLTEVAQRMNLSYGMVKVKHKKALEALKAQMLM